MNPALKEAFELMLVGMGVVIAFLVLLVGAMHAVGALFARFSHLFPDPVASAAPSGGGRDRGTGAASSEVDAAAVVAAAAAFRTRSGGGRAGSPRSS